jgi:hypothetical protein
MSAGEAGTEFVAKHALLSVDGVLMAAAKNWKIKHGLKTHEEPVCGTDIPRVLHGVFHGDVDCESIYVSGDNWARLTSLRDTPIIVVSTDKDTSAPQGVRTTTSSVKVTEFERQGPANADGVVKGTLKGTMVTEPTIA